MYQQTLIETLEDYIKPQVVKRLNKSKKWQYGYNKEHDIVIISKNGLLGEVVKIQNLVIGLPPAQDVISNKQKTWVPAEYPKE